MIGWPTAAGGQHHPAQRQTSAAARVQFLPCKGWGRGAKGGVSALMLEEGLLSGPHPIWHQEPVFMLRQLFHGPGMGGWFGGNSSIFIIHYIAIIVTSALPHIIKH